MTSTSSKRILFVTRRFPPSIGGMQTLAADVDRGLRTAYDVELVALRTSAVAHLAWFLPAALARTAFTVAARRVDAVVCGDAIVGATVAPVIALSRVPMTVMALGLDFTFPNPLYQRWIRWAIATADRVVAISSAAAAAVVDAGADPAKVAVVHPGIEFPLVTAADRADARATVVQRLGLDAETLMVLTLGRLVRRKGVAWFIEHVVPRLNGVTYVVAGDGPMRAEVDAAAAGHSGKVHVLGEVDEELRELLLRGTDVLVMPNIPVPGDLEGFGLVTAEAASRGTLVVASAIDGIREAVVDGVTGTLVEAANAERFAETINALALDRAGTAALAERYAAEARTRFSSKRMADDLVAAVVTSRAT